MEDARREINLQYGDVTVRAFREFYGSFAPHCADGEKLGDVFVKLDEASLTQIFRDYKCGKLRQLGRNGAGR
jgi:hypothetical protein